jgi:hypothetical protein
MGDLFWLSDEAWAAIEPHLPKNQPGARRVDDRRVISGICMSSRAAAGGAIAPPPMARAQRSTIASIAGRDGGSGSKSSALWSRGDGLMHRSPSTLPM